MESKEIKSVSKPSVSAKLKELMVEVDKMEPENRRLFLNILNDISKKVQLKKQVKEKKE
jgi:hypothetical protein